MVEETKSYSQMRTEFYRKYIDKIVPVEQKFESERKAKLRKAIIISSIFFISTCALIFFAITQYDIGYFKEIESIVDIFAFLFAVFGCVTPIIIKKNFENKIKEKIMPTVCSCLGDIKWSQGVYSGSNLFKLSGAIQEYTSATYDDIFMGSYNGVNIEIVESSYVRGSGKSKRIVFAGVIVKLDINKSFTGHTVIKSNSIIKASPSCNLHHTELEDTEFNKKYDVYTNDEVDARYLITPSFMERLKNMKVAFRATNINCAFFQKYCIIALSTDQDLFSIGSLTKPMDKSGQYFQMYDEILSIIKLIDHFKLNQKAGM